MRLDDIPTAGRAPADATPSAVVARLRALRPSRRTVLRGLLIGAAAAALVPLDWYLARREAAAQSTEGDDLAEHLTCTPQSYEEEADNWPASGAAVCYGGWRRGGFPCADGYHREGVYADGEDSADSTRVTTSCQGRNAWRWNGYRCSDAITTVTFADGTEYTGITIAACPVGGEGAATPTAEGSTTDEPGARSGDDERDEDDEQDDDDAPRRDPARAVPPRPGASSEDEPVAGHLPGR